MLASGGGAAPPPVLPYLLLVTGNASHLILIKPLNVPPGGQELVRRLIVTKNTSHTSWSEEQAGRP